jgi:hypothetical protein
MELAHAMHEFALGVAYVDQRLSGLRLRGEGDEVHRVTLAQRHSNL